MNTHASTKAVVDRLSELRTQLTMGQVLPTTELVRCQNTLISRSRQARLPLIPLGFRTLFTPALYVAGAERDWLIIDIAHDPLWSDPDGYPVPRAVLADIRRLTRVGVEFDTLYIAHELPAGLYLHDPKAAWATITPPPARAALQTAQRLGTFSQTVWRIAALPLLSAGAIVRHLATPSTSATVGFDPIVLGICIDPNRSIKPGALAAWFYIHHWTYNEEILL